MSAEPKGVSLASSAEADKLRAGTSSDMQADRILNDLARAEGIICRKAACEGLNRRQAILGNLLRREKMLEFGVVEHPFTQVKLARNLGVTSQALGELLAKMERDGLITRRQCTYDSRSLSVELTDTGRSEAWQVIERQRDLAERVLSCFTQAERDELGALLSKLNDSL